MIVVITEGDHNSAVTVTDMVLALDRAPDLLVEEAIAATGVTLQDMVTVTDMVLAQAHLQGQYHRQVEDAIRDDANLLQ